MSNYGGIMGKGFTGAMLVGIGLFASLSFAQGSDHPGKITDDSALVAAFEGRRQVSYVEAGNLTVTKILPDDTSGLPHQKWVTQLSDGGEITVIYNSDEGPRVPVKVGDKFGVGGQYIPTGNTGIIHWLHDDPRKSRPDGYVYLNGVVYGDWDREDKP